MNEQLTPDGAFHLKTDDMKDALKWYAKGMKITDQVKRLEYWEEDPERFARVTILVINEVGDMKRLASSLIGYHEQMAKIYERRTDLKFEPL